MVKHCHVLLYSDTRAPTTEFNMEIEVRRANYCYNIKAYHERKGEEQFYDFIIKDKNGDIMKSHKFILASQSEYFAGLFRECPTASQTTFRHFPIEVIKICIEYLYTQELKLAGNNVHDVLVFADNINLVDVVDICTNYIIRSIDESNFTLVMDLGNKRGIDSLIEAAVFYAIRNQKRKAFDDLTVKTIMKVARWQQKRPTIMTRQQWMISQLLYKFVSNPAEPDMVFETRCSSVYMDAGNYGPQLAVNGKVSYENGGFFHSLEEYYPWLEVKLPSPILIMSVTVINRQDMCYERLRNLEIRAGMKPVPDDFTTHPQGREGKKQLDCNSRCGFFAGPAEHPQVEPVFNFQKPILAQYLTLQIIDKGILQINGLKINGGTILNSNVMQTE